MSILGVAIRHVKQANFNMLYLLIVVGDQLTLAAEEPGAARNARRWSRRGGGPTGPPAR